MDDSEVTDRISYLDTSKGPKIARKEQTMHYAVPTQYR